MRRQAQKLKSEFIVAKVRRQAPKIEKVNSL
jgi:hypothetical protein